MRRLARVVAGGALVAGLSSCSLAQSLLARGVEGMARQAIADTAAGRPPGLISAEEQARCDALAKVPISLKEELAFGGAMAVGISRQDGGPLLDVTGTIEQLQSTRPPKPESSAVNDLSRYLDVVGKNLAAQSRRPTLPWTFVVIDSDSFNAFSAPGGYVFVTKGLLRKVKSEAQLAGVLAHEIAHITQGHALASYRQAKSTQCVLAYTVSGAKDGLLSLLAMAGNPNGAIDLDKASNFDALKVLTDATIELVQKFGFGAEKEYEADQVALALVVNAGYSPYEYIGFLDNLPDSGLLSAHPPKQDRQLKLKQYIEVLGTEGLLDARQAFKDYAVVPLSTELSAVKPSAPTASSSAP